MTKAELNQLWVRLKIQERGWTEEIELEAELVARARAELDAL
jgi:hypothetical protein